MNLKQIIFAIFLITLFLFLPQNAFAEVKLAGHSASMELAKKEDKTDNRIRVLEEYLKSFDSPLAKSASTFVEEADKYDIDYRLVAAISGVESTFGHFLPYNSYNAWGWGIYGDNMIYFSSFEEGIEIISKSLREKYIDSWGASNVYEIGKFYAESPTWASRVDQFMIKIEEFQNQTSKSLSLSL